MTAKTPDDMNEEALARFYEERKGDLSLWQKKPRQIRLRRGDGPSTMFSLRMTGEELSKIALAAQKRGTTVSDFIRRAALKEADGGDESAMIPPEVWEAAERFFASYLVWTQRSPRAS